MIPFFRLAAGGELKRTGTDPIAFFQTQNVLHIKLNEARYEKVTGNEEIAQKEETGTSGGGWSADSVEELSLQELLKKLVHKAVDRPEDREHVFSRALSLVKKQIDDVVGKAAAEFQKERARITSERERTEGVVGEMADGVVVVDESGKVLMMNPTAEKIYGVKLGEQLGKPLWEGVREEQMMSLAKDMTTATDRPVVKEVQIHGSTEARKTLRASSATVQDINGRIVGMVSVLSDVTKQKELTRMQNEFMANVTHDLRSPIHTMKLAVTAILEGAAGPVSEEQKKMLTMATKNADRLSRLIDDLLDFSKLESGALDVRPQIIELDPLINEATASMQTWAKKRNIALKYEQIYNITPVFADGDRVLQVVNNLLSNAIKFTPSGGSITVRSKNIEEGGKSFVCVEVEDSGKGISKDDQKRVFDRFVQLDNKEKQDIRGTGLGLGICKGLVELHKGRLWIESPLPNGKSGSIFSFTLPAVEGSTSKTAAPAASAQAASSPPPAKKKGFWKWIFSGKKTAILLALFISTPLWARPYWGTVRRVLDANTFQLSDGTKVRFVGIVPPDKKGPYYAEALASSRFWLEGKEVHLKYGLQERGFDDVWTAYVYVDGIFVNKELIKQGLALVSPLPNEEELLPDLIMAEKEAHDEKRGQWRDTVIDLYPLRIQKKSNTPKPSSRQE
jgi:PAS domain S-box-containing protein